MGIDNRLISWAVMPVWRNFFHTDHTNRLEFSINRISKELPQDHFYFIFFIFGLPWFCKVCCDRTSKNNIDQIRKMESVILIKAFGDGFKFRIYCSEGIIYTPGSWRQNFSTKPLINRTGRNFFCLSLSFFLEETVEVLFHISIHRPWEIIIIPGVHKDTIFEVRGMNNFLFLQTLEQKGPESWNHSFWIFGMCKVNFSTRLSVSFTVKQKRIVKISLRKLFLP